MYKPSEQWARARAVLETMVDFKPIDSQCRFKKHLYSVTISVSPQCDNCEARQENSQHLLLDCPKYKFIRKTMLDFVGTQISIFPKFCKRDKTKTLLYGYQPENLDYLSINRAITISVQTFLLKTQRFK